MNNLKIGDIVARKSYGCDIKFKITRFKEEAGERLAILKGVEYRLVADAPESDLISYPEENKTLA